MNTSNLTVKTTALPFGYHKSPNGNVVRCGSAAHAEIVASKNHAKDVERLRDIMGLRLLDANEHCVVGKWRVSFDTVSITVNHEKAAMLLCGGDGDHVVSPIAPRGVIAFMVRLATDAPYHVDREPDGQRNWTIEKI